MNLENAHGVINLISSFCIHGKAICLIAKRPFLFSWIGRGVREEEKKKTFQGKWKPCKEEIIMQVKLKFRVCWKTSIWFCLTVTEPFFLTPTLYHLVTSKSKGRFDMRRWTISFKKCQKFFECSATRTF